jgi:hypothetical protein
MSIKKLIVKFQVEGEPRPDGLAEPNVDITLTEIEFDSDMALQEAQGLAEMSADVISDISQRVNAEAFFHPYLAASAIHKPVMDALKQWRNLQLRIAATKTHIAKLRASIVDVIELKRQEGVDGKPHKDYKFLGTNKEEQAWSLQLLAPALFEEIALKEYTLELLEVEAKVAKTFLDLYISK